MGGRLPKIRPYRQVESTAEPRHGQVLFTQRNRVSWWRVPNKIPCVPDNRTPLITGDSSLMKEQSVEKKTLEVDAEFFMSCPETVFYTASLDWSRGV